jgi:tetratricopeptide (TPR) repeat protein
MAITYLHLNRLDEAERMFDKAAEIGEPYNLNKGHLLSRRGKDEEALEFYQRLRGEYGEYGKMDREIAIHCTENIGYYLHKQGRLDEAIEEYKKAISLGSPDPGGVWYEIAKIYATKEDMSSTVEALSRAINEEPEYGEWAKAQPVFVKYRDTGQFRDVVGEGSGHLDVIRLNRQATAESDVSD